MLTAAQKIHRALEEAFAIGVVRLHAGQQISVRDVTITRDLRQATVLWEAEPPSAAVHAERIIEKRKGWLTLHVNNYITQRLHAALIFRRYTGDEPAASATESTRLQQALAAVQAEANGDRRAADEFFQVDPGFRRRWRRRDEPGKRRKK